MTSIAAPGVTRATADATAPAERPAGQGGPDAANPFPVDTGPALAGLLRRHAESPGPIAVSFREMVSWMKVGERATHYIHPYPAKLLPHIAHFFLASRLLVGADEIVLDPFAGTGTVALETILSGRDAIHADANPLARLIAAAKTRPVEDDAIAGLADLVRDRFPRSRSRIRPDVVNLDRWYAPETMRQLIRLRAVLKEATTPAAARLADVTFSAVARRCSLADPRFSVPVRRREGDGAVPTDVAGTFLAQLQANRARMRELRAFEAAGSARSAGEDARRLVSPDGSPLPDGSVGMVMTSPPYAGAQKYVRAASLSLGWLDLAPSSGLRRIEDTTIGREHFRKSAIADRPATGVPAAEHLLDGIAARNPLRAHIAATYLSEMGLALAEAVRVLRPGGHLVLVIGDNTVCGERFPSSEFLPSMLHGHGMETVLSLVDTIRSRGLLTSRAATAGVILTESVIVLRKS